MFPLLTSALFAQHFLIIIFSVTPSFSRGKVRCSLARDSPCRTDQVLGFIVEDSSDEERETDHYTCMGSEDVDIVTDCGVLEDVFVTENNEQMVLDKEEGVMHILVILFDAIVKLLKIVDVNVSSLKRSEVYLSTDQYEINT